MQGFLLFLPVLLVILAAGSANGEAVSEVEAVLQPAHLQEKAEISLDRETRDAAKKDKTRRKKKKMKGKKSKKGKKKVNQKKAQKKARGRKKNKKDIQKK